MKNPLPSLTKGKPRHPWPARLLHWSYAPAVLVCILSGFYITKPSRLRGFKNMNSARKAHFIAQYILICSYVARVYYGYMTKNYKEIFPSLTDVLRMPEFLKYELFLTSKKPKYPKYNPGQKTVYTSFALLIPVQIVTGLGLYISNKFQKPAALAGGLNPLRKLHYLASVAISAMAAGHIYFALTGSLKKLKSMFTGYE